MAGENTYKESDGLAITVTLSYATDENQVAYVQQWLGITAQSGASGDSVALVSDRREYQFTVPSGLTVNKGDIVYIDTAHATLSSSHVPGDAAYSTSAGSNKVALFKATMDKDADDTVTGILLSQWAS